MASLLDAALNDITPGPEEVRFMQGLQANILKSHGREHVALLFLKINHLDNARAFLHEYPVSDAHTQHVETEAFKRTRAPGGVVRLVFLSRAGLAAFGHGGGTFGQGVFDQPMSSDAAVLDGGNTERWQEELRTTADALLLVAYHDADHLARIVGKLVSDLQGSVDDAPDVEAARPFKLLFVQEGRAYRNADREGIEHFGYVDGRSQPLMLESDIAKERTAAGGAFQAFDPTAPLNQFVLPDPLDAQAQGGHGSFFVFRKLEQNVARFKQKEAELAGPQALDLKLADRERAGAMAVGRFEDGTPVVLHPAEQGVPVVNDFNHDADANATRCPFHAHTRKTHPRGASPGGAKFDHGVQMARRGITYGARLQDPDTGELVDRPNDGVGLLFMSYQASIDDQFHFMQTQWANNANFPRAEVGLDPIIGQRSGGEPPQTWFPGWASSADPKTFSFDGFVTLKGGEYFYAPSIVGLKQL